MSDEPLSSPQEEAIEVYTDGAASGNPGPAGIGIFMRYKGKTKEISRYIGIATNNVAELKAIETALSAIRKPELPVILYTDSGYALGLLTLNWKAKKNVDLVARIRKLISRFNDLKIVKVRGHCGVEGNEIADKLATSAITNRVADAIREMKDSLD